MLENYRRDKRVGAKTNEGTWPSRHLKFKNSRNLFFIGLRMPDIKSVEIGEKYHGTCILIVYLEYGSYKSAARCVKIM